jgi:hypothetical protein
LPAGVAGPAVFYAAAWIDSPGGPALLRLSAVSSSRVWVNGRQVADILNPIREMDTESVVVPVRLKAGSNLLLLKVSQAEKRPAEFGAEVLPGQTPRQHVGDLCSRALPRWRREEDGAGLYLPDLNLANWLDRQYLPGRMYQGTWDNEGILSTFPAVVTCLAGVLAGSWLRSSRTDARKLRGRLSAGAASIALGWVWNLWLPVNKLIWTSSYVLVAGGWSLLLLALFYWVLDVKKWRRWSLPFVVIGANAIAVYAFAQFINFPEVAARLAGGRVATQFGAYREVWLALVAYLLTWGVLYWLYKKRVFIKR